MRLLAGFTLVLVGIAFAQSQLVVPQINNLNAIVSLLPQFQGFLGQLDNILPQLTGILSSGELQSLKDKITQFFLSQLGGNLNLNAIKDKLRPLLQQFLGSKPQGRIDFDALLQQIAGAAASTLPGILIGLLGKRELPTTDARIDLNDILALINKFPLSTILPQIQGLLSNDKFQELQAQIFATVLNGAGHNWNLNSIAQAIQQIVTQFVPQVAQMRIDWEQIGQQALNGLIGALPGVAVGLLGLLGKRELPTADARIDINAILALINKIPLSTILPQIQQLLGADKFQQLQAQIFGTIVNAIGHNWDIHAIAQDIQQLVTQLVPQAAQMRIDWEQVGQQALNGLIGALPGVAVGLLGLLGKRELPTADARSGLSDILGLVDQYELGTIIPHIEEFLGPDKLQELQDLFFNTVVSALGNNWNLATVAQALQQLVTQFIPQAAQMRIDWEQVGQQALNGLVGALPGIAVGLLGLLGKRELGFNYQQLLAQLPVQKLAQLIQVVTSADKATVLAKLRKLLQQFFPAYQGRINFDDLASTLLNHLNNLLPTLSQSIFSALLG